MFVLAGLVFWRRTPAPLPEFRLEGRPVPPTPSVAVDERILTAADSDRAVFAQVASAMFGAPDPLLGEGSDRWVSALLRPDLRSEWIGPLLLHLAGGTASERCRAALALVARSELHADVCNLVDTAEGEAAEAVWLALAGATTEPVILHEVLNGLSRTGTGRSLPVLRGLTVGPALRAEVDRVVAEVQEREGSEGGVTVEAAAPTVLTPDPDSHA